MEFMLFGSGSDTFKSGLVFGFFFVVLVFVLFDYSRIFL